MTQKEFFQEIKKCYETNLKLGILVTFTKAPNLDSSSSECEVILVRGVEKVKFLVSSKSKLCL